MLDELMRDRSIASTTELARRMLRADPKCVSSRKGKAPVPLSLVRQLNRIGAGTSVFAKNVRARAALQKVLGISSEALALLLAGRPAASAPSEPDDAWVFRHAEHGLGTLILGSVQYAGVRHKRAFPLGGLVDIGQTGEWHVKPPNLLDGYSSELHWIVAPSGAGKTLGQRHRTRQAAPGGGRAVSLRSLADLDDSMLGENGAFIDVDSPSPADRSVLERLARRGAVTIAAPFRRPDAPVWRDDEPDHAWHRHQQADPAERTRWLDWVWAPPENWRLWLLAWASQHAPWRHDLAVAAIYDALAAADPHDQLFGTPGAVLALCRLFDGHPDIIHARAGEPPLEQIAAAWMKERRFNSAAFRDLAVAALADFSQSWLGTAPREVWEARLPSARASDARKQELLDGIDALASAPKKNQSELAGKVKAMVHASAADLVDGLIAERHLCTGEDGALELAPRFVAAALGEAQLRALLGRDGNAGTWGRIAVARDRRPMVARALASLDHAAFVLRVREAATTFDTASLGAVGAVELLAEDVGRRILAGWEATRSDRTALAALLRLQLQTLTRRHDSTPLCATTFPGIYEEGGDTARLWLARCWALSFELAAPGPVPAGAEWLFPGWCELDPAAPEAKGALDWHRGQPGELERLNLVPKVVARLRPGTRPSGLLVPHAWVDSVAAGDRQHVTFELEPGWMITPIIALVRDRGGDPAPFADALYTALWPTTGVLLDRSDEAGKEDKRWILEHLSLPLFRETFSKEMRTSGGTLAGKLRAVPGRLWSTIVDLLLDSDRVQQHGFIGELDDLGREHLDVLEQIFERQRRDGARTWPTVRRLSQLDSARGLALAVDALTREPEAQTTAELVWEAVQEDPGKIFALLENQGLPAWAGRWLIGKVHEGGALADRAYALLSTTTAQAGVSGSGNASSNALE